MSLALSFMTIVKLRRLWPKIATFATKNCNIRDQLRRLQKCNVCDVKRELLWLFATQKKKIIRVSVVPTNVTYVTTPTNVTTKSWQTSQPRQASQLNANKRHSANKCYNQIPTNLTLKNSKRNPYDFLYHHKNPKKPWWYFHSTKKS